MILHKGNGLRLARYQRTVIMALQEITFENPFVVETPATPIADEPVSAVREQHKLRASFGTAAIADNGAITITAVREQTDEVAAARVAFLKAAIPHIDAGRAQNIAISMQRFESRMLSSSDKKQGVKSVGNTYKQLAELIDASKVAPLSIEQRVNLAERTLFDVANPHYATQSERGSVKVDAELRVNALSGMFASMLAKCPEKIARLIRDYGLGEE